MKKKEIERKFLIESLDLVPYDLNLCECLEITQAYIFFEPVVRLRKQNEQYFLTIKSKGLLIHDEFEISIEKSEFDTMWQKSEGTPVEKKRYMIPLLENLICELDIFSADLDSLIIAEVEFSTLEEANAFLPPKWFGKELTYIQEYSNKNLSRYGIPN